MATVEEIETLLGLLMKAPPSESLQKFDMSTAGIRAILKLLNETEGKMTAGRISELMHVSTARVAVLLKKMTAKGLIEKQTDSEDRRVVVVKLSDSGRATAEKFKAHLYGNIGDMIDKVGMKKMLEFAAISGEIHSVMKKPDIDI